MRHHPPPDCTFQPIKGGMAYRKRDGIPRQDRLHMERRYRERRGMDVRKKSATPRPSVGRLFEWAALKVLRAMCRDGGLVYVRKTETCSSEDWAGTDFVLVVCRPEVGRITINMGVTTCLKSYHGDKKRYKDSIQLYFQWGVGTAPDKIRERVSKAIDAYVADLIAKRDQAQIDRGLSDQSITNMIANLADQEVVSV